MALSYQCKVVSIYYCAPAIKQMKLRKKFQWIHFFARENAMNAIYNILILRFFVFRFCWKLQKWNAAWYLMLVKQFDSYVILCAFCVVSSPMAIHLSLWTWNAIVFGKTQTLFSLPSSQYVLSYYTRYSVLDTRIRYTYIF